MAQDMLPYIDGVGAYHHAQTMRYRGNEAAKKKQNPTTAPNAQGAPSAPPTASAAPSKEQARAALKAEYERRIRRDGQASADSWLAAEARAMGRRDGAIAARQQGQVPR